MPEPVFTWRAWRAELAAIVPAFALLCAAGCTPPPVQPGALQLSNLNFGPTHVEAVITANPDCAARGPGYLSTLEFLLPPNSTKLIGAPPGADICWRRDRDPGQPVAGEWSPWGRAYVAPGRRIDANL
ncbi:MAG TPA: hypothetical protein VGF07_03575 [Stellaceae bacterium]